METTDERAARALALAKGGRFDEAFEVYLDLLGNTHVVDFEYDAWLRSAADASMRNRPRQAAYIRLYLQEFAAAAAGFSDQPLELARISEWSAKRATGELVAQLHKQAGDRYVEAGRHVMAAIAFQQAGAYADSRASWQRVLKDPRLREQMYEQALVHFNLGEVCQAEKQFEEANRHLISAQRTLEEVADDFETRGERERAFDCYAILLKLGRDGGSYENLAEGYINCIRVLKEDNLKFYVLQYYEDFLRISLEREEFHAAAAVCREAADYSRRVGLVYDRGYLKRAAETWWKAAEKNQRIGGPVEITENAYLAAIEAYNTIGDFFRVRESYKQLVKLPLGDAKQKRYETVAERYAEVWQEVGETPPFPEYLKQQHAYPEIWHLDLIEWELDGDPLLVCGGIVGDSRYADIIRRRALLVILREIEGGTTESFQRTALGLGELQAYAALRPLERLYANPHAQVRVAVMSALKHLYFKRTFGLVQKGLRDADAQVRAEALASMGSLHFPHAFDPLVRIFREYEEPRVRQAALESVGRIASLEAGEFLIEVLRYEPDPLRGIAARLLQRFDNPDIFPILRRHLESETGATRETLESVLA